VLHFQGNLLAFGTACGHVVLWDIALNRAVNVMQSHFARVGALAWIEDVLFSGSSDRSILQCDIRTKSGRTGRKLLGHQEEVSRNVLNTLLILLLMQNNCPCCSGSMFTCG
jgi:cell division cycle 20-like protein 1 (cofactor of APC complex)